MAVVLTAMNRFLNEDDGLQMAFLDGFLFPPFVPFCCSLFFFWYPLPFCPYLSSLLVCLGVFLCVFTYVHALTYAVLCVRTRMCV
jgi:hypothetical protein